MAGNRGHAVWVRMCHWVIAASVLTMAYSGIVILMAHPRLYWGNTGNDLTRALVELPLGPNYRHGGWGPPTAFFATPGSPVTEVRTFEIFNQNGWARSLHFLIAWVLVGSGGLYLVLGVLSGHLGALVPRLTELTPGAIWRDLKAHLVMRIEPTAGGPPYGVLQKIAYLGVACIALPMMVLTGLSMSPAVGAAWPWLPALFGGTQSARTIHFGFLCLLALFLIAHLAMVMLSGPWRQLRAMTIGQRRTGGE